MTTPPKCIRHSFEDICSTADMGSCQNPGCSNETSSGGYRYCNECSITLDRCYLCGAAITFVKTEVLAAIDKELKRWQFYLDDSEEVIMHKYARDNVDKLGRLRSQVDQGEITSLEQLKKVRTQIESEKLTKEEKPSLFRKILDFLTI